MDAHTPYVPAPRHLKAVTGDRVGLLRTLRAHARTGLGLEVDAATLGRLRQLYAAAVHQVDASVARLLCRLEAMGIRDRTCVVIAGDHGEEFQEHGHLAHYPKLYDELVRVPFAIDHPDGGPREIERAVGLEAIGPTICAAMGIAPPEEFEGESLLGEVRDGVPRGHEHEADGTEPVVSVTVRGETITQQPIPRDLEAGELLVSARTTDWSYIYHTDTNHRELYERGDEHRNRWEEFAGSTVAQRLHAAAERHATRIGGDPEADAAADEPPSGVADRLEALGYQ